MQAIQKMQRQRARLSIGQAPRLLVLSLTADTDQLGAHLLARYPGAEVRLVPYTSAKSRSPRALLRELRAAPCDLFVVGLEDLDTGRDTPLWRLIALLARARRRAFLDLSGRWRPVTWPRFLLLDLPYFAFGLLLSGLGAAALLPRLYLLRAQACRRQPRSLKECLDTLHVAFLRTDLVYGLKAGGSVSHIAGFTSALTRLGHRVAFFSTDHLPGRPPESPIAIIRPARLLSVLPEIRNLLFNLRFIRRTFSHLRKHPPDLLYQRYAALDVTGPLLARRLGCPYILEFNSSVVWKGKFWGGIRLLWLAALTEEICLWSADYIVVVSEPLRQDLLAMGLPDERILVNPNGVDPTRFHPHVDGSAVRTCYGFAPNQIVVGFTGTFGVWHGVPVLAEILAPVLAADPRIRFLLVGDGELRYLIEEAVARHGLDDCIVRTGLIPHDQIPAHLAACDVLLSPHTPQADGREFFGSPTKLFEYMAMGKAIVASNLGQIGLALENEVSALLTEPGNATQVIEAVLRLASDADLRDRLGAAARHAALEGYTWDANARRLLQALGLHEGEIDP